MAIFGRFHLLCNGCNWQFAGFAIPGTIDTPSQKRKHSKSENSHKQTEHATAKGNSDVLIENSDAKDSQNTGDNSHGVRVKRRVRVKLTK
jgi:hypothetical protein